MRLYLISLIIVIFYLNSDAQDGFPENGVKNTFEPVYALVNAHITISPGKTIQNGTILIQNGTILSVDSNVNIPKGAIIKDLEGDFIYPSFIDLYSDYGIKKIKKGAYSYRPQYKSSKTGAYHWNETIHPEVNASQLFNNDEKIAKDYLSAGFGSVMTHQKNGIFRGTGTLVLLASKKSENENILITNAAACYSFKKGVSAQTYPTSLMGGIALFKQTLLDAQWHNQSESKSTNISLSAYNQNIGLPQIFEANDALDYARIYSIADEFEIQYIVKGNGDEYAHLEELKSTNFDLIIPLNFPASYDVSNPEEADWISLRKLKEWETAPFNAAMLKKNKIKFALTSSDLKKKKDFIPNLRKAILHGLSKNDALAALTTIPASLLNIQKIGTLEEGMIANFFISSDDIFDTGIIYENWVNGEAYTINEKQKLDIRGYYTFNSKKYKNSFLKIEGEKNKPAITFIALDSSLMISKLNNTEITFSKSNGNFRAIGNYKNNVITGKFQLADGSFESFSMRRDSIFKQKNKNLKKERKPIPPTIWSPNQAYGFNKKKTESNIIFQDATVWTNEKEGILTNTDVAIKNNKIIAIGNNLIAADIFPDKQVEYINATNKHLTSGIIDEHSHIAITRGVNESSEAVTAEVNIGDVINPKDINIYRQLAGGVTAAQLLHGSANPIGGQSALIKMRWGSTANEMKIKNVKGFIKFALGENVKQSNWGDFNTVRFPQTRMGVEQVFYDAFYRAKEYRMMWDEYNSLSLRKKRLTSSPREDLELNILLEILDEKRFITCHSYVQSEINMLMHVADSMGFKVNTFTHILEGYKVADKMKNHPAGGSTFSDWWAYKFEVNDAIPYNATLLNNAGVLTAINSDDAEMGRRLNQEAAKAIKYGGTTQEDAWKMVTLNPAKLLHLDDRMGSIKVGKDADLVIWSDNPLSVYSKVEQTYVDGICLYDKNKNQLLLERDLKERMRILQMMSKDKNKHKQKPKRTKVKLYHCDTIEHENHEH